MHWSYRIFRIFGIDVRVHATFLFIVAYFAFVWGAMREPGGWIGALYGVLLVVLLFALVLIHELSHSRVAQHYGIEVKNITLLPWGGIVHGGDPQEPRKELVISVVGPLSNVVLGLLMLAAAPLSSSTWARSSRRGSSSNLLLSRGFVAAYVYLFVVNLTLAVFNLLPAFPMDGGRVFRAFLAMRMGRPGRPASRSSWVRSWPWRWASPGCSAAACS